MAGCNLSIGYVIVFLAVMIQGSQMCDVKDLTVSQKATGKLVNSKPEWNVTVTNKCICGQWHVTFPCKGFQTEQPLNSSVISRSGNVCTLADSEGALIFFQESTSFTYAWDTKYAFKPTSSSVACS